MARGKNPEETRKKILDVAKELFLQKGYDNTSLQDIVNGLGGMTKGVIYHHFDSKFDILKAIVNTESENPVNFSWRGANAFEELQNSLKDAFSNLERQKIAYSAAITLRSPRLLGEQYLEMFKYAVPQITAKVNEGIADGSIETIYPEELAELIVLTFNVWIGFQASKLSELELKRKILFIKAVFEGLGVKLIDDEMILIINTLFSQLKK